ncbi:DUF1731 domain-containing protein [Spirillospora sp. CA-108201]
MKIAKDGERAQQRVGTPSTRKVAPRSAMVVSPDCGGVFDHLLWPARLGLGGPVAGGAQYVSWIHDQDFVRALEFLIDQDDIAGPVNLAAPNPLPQPSLMRDLRRAWGVPVGLPTAKWMAELGALALRSDTEPLMKSRRVVPGRLLEEGFTFRHPQWQEAAEGHHLPFCRVHESTRSRRFSRKGGPGGDAGPSALIVDRCQWPASPP